MKIPLTIRIYQTREKRYKICMMNDRMFYPVAMVTLESNGSFGKAILTNTRYQMQTEWHIGINKSKGYEDETVFGRYLGKMQWWFPYIGWDIRDWNSSAHDKNLFGQTNTADKRKVVCAGIQYTLPMLVIAEVRIDSQGKLRFQLSRDDIPLTARLRFNFFVNTDKESTLGLGYIITKYFGVSAHFDTDTGYGGGIFINY